jgi:hypothetical protein
MTAIVPKFSNWTSPKRGQCFGFEREFLESVASTAAREAPNCDLLTGLMSFFDR